MPLTPIEVNAATVDAAITDGLAQLGLARDQVVIAVLQEPSRGILGIGAHGAIVRLTPRVTADVGAGLAPTPALAPAAAAASALAPVPAAAPAAAPPATAGDVAAETAPALDRARAERLAADTLSDLLDRMRFRASVHPHWVEAEGDDDEPMLVLDVQGHDLGVLIGHRGETLGALQYITRLIASRQLDSHFDLVIDVAGYKARREQQLRRIARQAAAQATQRHRTVLLDPMSPSERRIIHLTLRHHPEVITRSVGEGDRRKVTIVPKDMA
jgi:spoIIIJ-associated protein